LTHEVSRIEDSVLIDATPERVWQIITNPWLSPRWNSNIVEIRDVSGLPVEKGTSWVQVVRILGRKTEMRAVVEDVDPPHGGTVRFSGPGEPLLTSRVEAEGSGTRLTQIMDVTIPKGIGGMAVRIAIPTIVHELKSALRAQKSVAEDGSV
jgi:uncharacterized protein YndB with AHSA1/START domain